MEQISYAMTPDEYARCDTAALRERFLVDGLFQDDALTLRYTHHDRMLIAGAVPRRSSVALEAADVLGTGYFLERREVGIVNIGGEGAVRVGDDEHALAPRDCLYVGRGHERVSLASSSASDPARFYLVSAPAHAALPTQRVSLADGQAARLGSPEEGNERTLTKLIHAEGVESSQLMLGLTQMHGASIWNTMPAHIHDRRTEIYLYFALPAEARVFHLMGPPDETRHLVVANEQAVISPGWSIHAGAGTQPYAFIWAMAGETYSFQDMAVVAPADLR